MEAVRLRNSAGTFFRQNQAIRPTTIAKFMRTASQNAPSSLSPVILASRCTEAECLNCAVSSSPELWFEPSGFCAGAEAVWAAGSEFCGNAGIDSIRNEKRIATIPAMLSRVLLIAHLPKPAPARAQVLRE